MFGVLYDEEATLHSNMVLLIRINAGAITVTDTDFTFQYGSINTAQQNQARFTTHVFTFQYGSINTKKESGVSTNQIITLHSNMVLLILHR